jgi:probable HAF family extracellular repeat protein
MKLPRKGVLNRIRERANRVMHNCLFSVFALQFSVPCSKRTRSRRFSRRAVGCASMFAVSLGNLDPSLAQTFQPLGFLSNQTQSIASGISGNGSTAAGYGATPLQAFRWTAGGMAGLGTLSGDRASDGRGLSGDGNVVVGGSYNDTQIQAFRWTPGSGMTGLGMLPGGQVSFANAANSDGSVVVGTSGTSSTSAEAFRWPRPVESLHWGSCRHTT